MSRGKRAGAGAGVGWTVLDAQRLVQRLGGARLCYGKPVHAGSRTVIPVAAVRLAGGFGFNRSRGRRPPPALPPGAQPPPPAHSGAEPSPADTGLGGGGALDARPLGFIEIGPEGAAYRPISSARTGALAGAAVTGMAALALRRLSVAAPRTRRLRRRLGRATRPRAAALPWLRRWPGR